ncbi:alpha/beta fold hydrolase [Entomospira culicis]|uniref:Alpha/beta hydrolase n=1 Tax=Entomospira culicis TaxID=2719989 RepID=A0A968GLW1_9SPIO|nr:alpha/beta hydrolase [Entomospira culicis]NIZ19955.1 alpha/beta hydrolase [Entomospira culicis]NIZ70180.1 alpha/beta hydrolase [Entomospira culicis]WDI38013.1 alpha/beta hydrolase [Entomospira culicis]WDI39636.1 alpha/beta hydrolase [Entomospira culicis]
MQEGVLYIKNGEKIGYRRAGVADKQKVLLLNGHEGYSSFYMQLMVKLAQEYDVLMIDLRGCGQSSYLRSFSSFAELAVDVQEVLGYLSYRDAYLIGWLYGGAVALELAAINPEIKGCILLSSIGLQGYRTFPSLQKNVDEIGVHEEVKKQLMLRKLNTLLLEIYQEQEMLWSDLLGQRVEGMLPVAGEVEAWQDVAMAYKMAMLRFNMSKEFNGIIAGSGRIAKINCPLLIVYPHADKAMDFSIWRREELQQREEATKICLLPAKSARANLLLGVIQEFVG